MALADRSYSKSGTSPNLSSCRLAHPSRMASTDPIHIPAPSVGQRFADGKGRQWSVEDVQPLAARGSDYYVLAVKFHFPHSRSARFKMSSPEFVKLATSGGFKPLR